MHKNEFKNFKKKIWKRALALFSPGIVRKQCYIKYLYSKIPTFAIGPMLEVN